MPLTICLECSGQISDAARACPHCGRPQAAGIRGLTRGFTLTLLWLLNIVLFFYAWSMAGGGYPAALAFMGLTVGLLLYTPYWFIATAARRRRMRLPA